jgi:hypothetical protein
MATAVTFRMVTAMVATTTRSRPGSRNRHPRRRGGRDSADGQVLGALLVIGGIAWFLQQVGIVHVAATTTLSCLLITLGIGLVLTARRAGGGGLVLVGIVLTVVLASASAVDVGLLQRGVGERTFTPSAVDDLEDRYQLGVGSLTLDLTELPADAFAGQTIDVQVGVGELVVLLPPRSELGVEVHAGARAGELDILSLDGQDDGTNLSETFKDPDAGDVPRVGLDLDVGLGTVQVVRSRAPR